MVALNSVSMEYGIDPKTIRHVSCTSAVDRQTKHTPLTPTYALRHSPPHTLFSTPYFTIPCLGVPLLVFCFVLFCFCFYGAIELPRAKKSIVLIRLITVGQ